MNNRTRITVVAIAVLLASSIGVGRVSADENAPAVTADPPAATKPSRQGPQWTIQVDPLTTALGFVHVQVERALSAKYSVYVGPHARLFDSVLDDKDEDFVGFGLEAGVRWFFRGRAPQGTWAQVRGVAARLSTDDNSTIGGYASVLVGHTWILSRRWVLAAGLGVQYLHYTIDGLGVDGVLPAAHTTVGAAF